MLLCWFLLILLYIIGIFCLLCGKYGLGYIVSIKSSVYLIFRFIIHIYWWLLKVGALIDATNMNIIIPCIRVVFGSLGGSTSYYIFQKIRLNNNGGCMQFMTELNNPDVYATRGELMTNLIWKQFAWGCFIPNFQYNHRRQHWNFAR